MSLQKEFVYTPSKVDGDRHSHVLVHDGHLLTHLLGVVPSTLTLIFSSSSYFSCEEFPAKRCYKKKQFTMCLCCFKQKLPVPLFHSHFLCKKKQPWDFSNTVAYCQPHLMICATLWKSWKSVRQLLPDSGRPSMVKLFRNGCHSNSFSS